jgi:hypothetical protein
MKRMGELLYGGRPFTTGTIDASLVTGSWKRLVYGYPPLLKGRAGKGSYVFCVLTEFHRRLKRRDVYAEASAAVTSGGGWADGGRGWPTHGAAGSVAVGA